MAILFIAWKFFLKDIVGKFYKPSFDRNCYLWRCVNVILYPVTHTPPLTTPDQHYPTTSDNVIHCT